MTNIPEQINLGALASVVERLRNTYTWLADIDYPGVGEAMASCEAGVNAINDLLDLACRTDTPSEQGEAVADVRELAERARMFVLGPSFVMLGFNETIRLAAEYAIRLDRAARDAKADARADYEALLLPRPRSRRAEMTAYNDKNENLMADRLPALDQKGLDAAQAYISERMEGTGLAPLFATPIIRAYFSAISSEQGKAAPAAAKIKWHLCAGTQPVAISVIAAYFDEILGEWICDVIDPPFSWNEHAYLGQYTYWMPLSAILPPTGFPRNP